MEEFADTKENETTKVVHTYTLVRACDMSEEMKIESIEVIMTACEKYGTDYFMSSKVIKQTLDKKYGLHWNVVVGEAFGIQMTHQINMCVHIYFGGNLAICAWKV